MINYKEFVEAKYLIDDTAQDEDEHAMLLADLRRFLGIKERPKKIDRAFDRLERDQYWRWVLRGCRE